MKWFSNIIAKFRNLNSRDKRFGRNSVISNSTFGVKSYVNYNSIIANCKVGNYCSIGPNCVIGLGNHPVDFVSSSSFFYQTGNLHYTKEQLDVNIGHDVWIGANTTILNGVHIGTGAIIGANTLVNRNVPPYAIYGGVPARLIKHRFSPEIIEKLLTLKWWELDENLLLSKSSLMNNIESFLEEFEYEV